MKPQYTQLGTLRTDYLEVVFGALQTNKIIIMDEREEHIKLRHPEDYELLSPYAGVTVNNPDFVLIDEKVAGTIIMVKRVPGTIICIKYGWRLK